MMIVMDTNVLVSALLRPYGKPNRILRLVLGGIVTLAMDGRILAEYREVLLRPKFSFPKSRIDRILAHIKTKAVFAPPYSSSLTLPDPDDVVFLEVALSSYADALVTGNKRDYPAPLRHGMAVMTPDEFLRDSLQDN